MSDGGGFYALGTSATLARLLADGLVLPVLGHAYLLSVGDVLLLCGATGFIGACMLGRMRTCDGDALTVTRRVAPRPP